MFSEFQMDDIVFGFFSKVGASIGDIYYFWVRNSVSDIVYMLMQMLPEFEQKSNIVKLKDRT